MIYKLTNDFHRTAVYLRSDNGWLSRAQVQRARHTLCGVSGCTCGGELGERGRQEHAVIDLDTRPHVTYPVRVGSWEDRI